MVVAVAAKPAAAKPAAADNPKIVNEVAMAPKTAEPALKIAAPEPIRDKTSLWS
ncbi:MAG: hypothetical protein AABP62_29305 [Planctomycetota bacterium]